MEIYIKGEIVDASFDELQNEIKGLKPKENIDIYISSNGGSVDAGFTIANYITGLSKNRKITTNILGNVDSIATIIFLSVNPENRYASAGSSFMGHEPSLFLNDFVKIDDLNRISQMLEHERQRIADYYARRIDGLTKEKALEGMKTEMWLNSEKMQELGIAKTIEYSIAAKKNINQKNNNMFNLFNKKENKNNPIHLIELGEIKALWTGELITAGTEFATIDGVELPDGEYETLQGVLIIKDSKLDNFKENVENVLEEEDVQDIAQLIAEALSPIMERLDALEGGEQMPDEEPENSNELEEVKAELEEIKAKATQKSTAKIPKRKPIQTGSINAHTEFMRLQNEKAKNKRNKNKK